MTSALGDPARNCRASNGREIVYSAGGVSAQSLWRVSASGAQAPTRLPYRHPAASPRDCPHAGPHSAYTCLVNNVNLWRLDVGAGERREHIGSTYESRLPRVLAGWPQDRLSVQPERKRGGVDVRGGRRRTACNSRRSGGRSAGARAGRRTAGGWPWIPAWRGSPRST